MYFRLQRNALASALIALAFCSIALFLWPQTAVGQDSAQGGGTNSPPVTLPRHAPGHLSRVSDLDVRIAAGQAPDPLSGSPTIISWDKLSLVFHDSSNQFMRKTYDVDPNLNVPAVKSRSGMQSVNGAGNMGIAAGYLGGTAGWLDIAAAWEYPAGRISVYVSSYDGNLGISTNATLNTSDQVLGGMISAYCASGSLPAPMGTAYKAVLPYQTFRTATDDIGVSAVKVALQDSLTRRYVQPNGTLSASFAALNAISWARHVRGANRWKGRPVIVPAGSA